MSANYVFKPTAEEMLRLSGPPSHSGGLTRRYASSWSPPVIRVFLAVILVAGWSLCTAGEDPRQYETPSDFLPRVGEPLPDFMLPRLDGGTASVSSFAGRPLVLTFFFSDCAPCIRDVGALNTFAQKNTGFGVVAITFDTAKRAGRFVEERGLNWPVLIEAKAYLDSIGVLAFPSFALLDGRGILLGATYGNQLGGEDGTVTANGLERWAKSLVPDA